MKSPEMAIEIKNISKVYRIGLRENIHDSISTAIFDFIKQPLRNYRKYRSLYRFDDINSKTDFESEVNASDIIWALKDVSFEIHKGEVLGIIGRNGAGKSTLLKILSKITCPTSGYARIRGRISSLLEVGTGFHPELTGRENIYLNGTVLGMRKKEVDRKFDEIVDFSGVEKFLDTPVKRYSSGMTVRLAFAVAAHLEPEILLVDEVLAVGDAAFQKKCLNKMQEVGRHGRTVLFVSHNMSAITRLCERAVLIESGRLIKDGPSHEIVSEYLASEEFKAGVNEWPDPVKAPGNDIVRLLAVRIRNGEGQIVTAVDISRPIRIEMEYEVHQPGFTLFPHFQFHNETGVYLFVAIEQDPTWQGRSRPKGRYITTAWIPGNLLNEGTVFVDPVMRTIEPDILHFCEENAVTFEAIEVSSDNPTRGGYTKGIPGAMRPKLKWTTEFIPNES
jgi:lipopolysaccharide transport system ATP-binding protein